MGFFNYKSGEENFKEVIDELKSLPKVEAPDNFEFVLMQKIVNKNFSNKQIEKNKFLSLSKLIPISAGAVTVVILFFIFQYNDYSIKEDPLMLDPPMRSEFVSGNESPPEELEKIYISKNNEEKNSENYSTEEKNKTEENTNTKTFKVIIKPNDAITMENVKLPFNDQNSIDVDDYVNNKLNPRSAPNKSTLVSDNPVVGFDGFYRPYENDEKIMNELKSRVDSIRKYMEDERRKLLEKR